MQPTSKHHPSKSTQRRGNIQSIPEYFEKFRGKMTKSPILLLCPNLPPMQYPIYAVPDSIPDSMRDPI